MKKLIITIVTLLLSINPAELSAQSLIHRLGKAIESEVKKEVKKAVNNQKKNTPPAKKQPQKKGEPKNYTVPFAPAEIQPQQFSGNPVPYDPAAPATGKHLGKEWVDLGLPSGIRWAAHNFDSARPDNPGKYYAWGGSGVEAEYSRENSDCYGIPLDNISGKLDYDAVRKRWGRGWRIPTATEFQELMEHCDREYIQQGKSFGIKLTSKVNGQSIFLPLTGYKDGWNEFGTDTEGLYWTATPYSDDYTSYSFHFTQTSGEIYYAQRHIGCCIRPVSDKIEEVKMITSGEVAGHNWIDLGLPSGTRWATTNIDAQDPSKPGKHYSWGETSPKSSYTESNSINYRKKVDDYSGNSKYDVAASKWGNGWRTPTRKEFSELVFFCDCKYVQQDGRWGMLFTSPKNGESIFLPATGHKEGSSIHEANGCGLYWTSSPGSDTGAHMYQFGGALGEMSTSDRSYGQAVRAVLEKANPLEVPASGQTDGHEWVDLGLPSGTKWATHNLGARYPEMNGDHFGWGETTDILDTKSPKNDMDNNPNASSIAGDPTTDAATSKWGKGWRTPEKEEFQELIDHCQWEWVTLCGRSGYKVTSKTNGQWIFLPAAGTFTGALLYEWPSGTDISGAYWTSTPVTGRTSYDSYNINFDHRDSGINISSGSRNNGFSIRPVTSGTAH